MIKALRQFFLVRRCVCCREVMLDSREEVFCAGCRAEYERLKRLHCRVCGKPHTECGCVPPKLFSGIECAVHLIPYTEELSHRLLYALKRRNDRILRRFLADELCRSLRRAGVSFDQCDITFAPRLPKSVRRYGFDQAKRLAFLIGRRIGLPVVKLFSHRHRSSLQKNLTAGARASNAEQSYRLRRLLPKKRGTRLVIVDDVITTGSTMAKLVSLAKTLGYREITVVCVARSIWKGSKQ